MRRITTLFAGTFACLAAVPARAETPAASYSAEVRPLLTRYCLGCHSTKAKKGSLDLERFGTLDAARKDLKVWGHVIEQLEAGEMPPKGKPQPTAEERRRIVAWVRTFLDAEARARAGDPGHVPLRRLSNAEYDYTVRDLTGVDLRPAKEFPADGAAGEGFTNAAEALSDISPALLEKYLAAAKEIAAHAVLFPDGLRFSPGKTRRDWTDESLARLRNFYRPFTADGRLPLQPYLAAAVRHRDALLAGRTTPMAVAEREKLNSKYLGTLWQALTGSEPSYPLDQLRAHWRTATEKDVGTLLADVGTWQAALWQIVPIGSYRYGNTVRQVPADPVAVESQTIRSPVKPVPGQADVVLYLSARDLVPAGTAGSVVWGRPRLEAAGKPPLLLRDYAEYGPKFEIDFATVFADTAKYLALVAKVARDRKPAIADAAKAAGLDPALAKRWAEVTGLIPEAVDAEFPDRPVPADTITLLDDKVEKASGKPAVNGWKKKGTDLPTVVANNSDAVEQIPGRVSPRGIAVHPTPTEYVAAVWTSPIEGRVLVGARVAHAHPACGNGVAWWLEFRRGDRAAVLADGAVNLGATADCPAQTVNVKKGDRLVLAVDARDGNHVCDLTEIRFKVGEPDRPERTWDLSLDVSGGVLDGNPHADRLGNKGVWSFVRGPARPTGSGSGMTVPPGSVLAEWREAATDPARQAEAEKLAARVQALLLGGPPGPDKHPDTILFERLATVNGPLFRGLDLSGLRKKSGAARYGLPKERFDADGNLVVPADKVVEVRLPA
ncbi:MAG: DUF1587 domain-containing protein, partial [Zavarzinella sp.]|nr:DUF1587 domain-containing protein [Zavarzinella sp.]